jgi:polysaccharide export outer membrane protein
MLSRLCLLIACLSALAAAEPLAGYRLIPGDLLRVTVLGEAELSVELRVPAEGQVTYPLIGRLAVLAGRSPEAVRVEIHDRLADGYLRQPDVNVMVLEFAASSAWVIGAVTKPGAVRLDPQRPTTAAQALGEAGGMTEDADRLNARILRDDPDRPGGKRILPLPLSVLPDDDVVLVRGDVVVVPRRDRVFVLGQVLRPGAVPLPAREVLTVSRAVALVGGFDRFAKENNVHLLRAGQDPVVLDVRAVLEGDKDAIDPPLSAGDTVFVPESRF